jgi:hypothetical protein
MCVWVTNINYVLVKNVNRSYRYREDYILPVQETATIQVDRPELTCCVSAQVTVSEDNLR